MPAMAKGELFTVYWEYEKNFKNF